jgi:hypothetical protein
MSCRGVIFSQFVPSFRLLVQCVAYNQPAHTRLMPNHHARSIHLYRASDTTQSRTRHEKIERCAQPRSPLPVQHATTTTCDDRIGQSSPQPLPTLHPSRATSHFLHSLFPSFAPSTSLAHTVHIAATALIRPDSHCEACSTFFHFVVIFPP